MLRYAASELAFRSGRSLVTAGSIALAVLAALLLTSLATSYARALRVPIETVGADVIVQQQGDIPPKLEGLMFPHPNALIPAGIIGQIRTMSGVIDLTRAVYMWDLEPDRYASVLGIDDGEAGLAGLGQRLTDGKPITAMSSAVLLDSDYAAKNHAKVGDTLELGGRPFPVAGIVDAARTGKLVRADVYMPLPVAQALAVAAPQVKALYPFGANDANLVLVKVNREQLPSVVEKITALVGKKGLVSSELSMRDALSGVLFLSQGMGLIIAAIIGLFAAAFVWRATATSVAERRREIAILQAIGWSWRHIRQQVLVENLALAAVGTCVGVAAALIIVAALGNLSVTVDLPWDLSSTPHFIPQATINRSLTITTPLSVPWLTAGVAASSSLVISLLAVLAVLALPRPQPWSVLRGE
jgi:putative ABC transport system permease protein